MLLSAATLSVLWKLQIKARNFLVKMSGTHLPLLVSGRVISEACLVDAGNKVYNTDCDGQTSSHVGTGTIVIGNNARSAIRDELA